MVVLRIRTGSQTKLTLSNGGTLPYLGLTLRLTRKPISNHDPVCRRIRYFSTINGSSAVAFVLVYRTINSFLVLQDFFFSTINFISFTFTLFQ
ncbi:uncharacterized protein BDR25DRAFT_348874 [Lindgomyces ingoldianus]|uniref:Uncharacterized protein n=1 Tax=Lindgomyces ingoldianus TaxID=673940 RepID=A0ACB6RCZ6_9PLEO|nr:uncharacterized protein BDR25DRAFT_348874 [Lindgomyces ingoldianus]KAF2476972.1 hypothetical protein BDR25DRAFT_348874 [Lindgomyces ingoldianus]